jgi:predicted metalloprotease with PDZ domain
LIVLSTWASGRTFAIAIGFALAATLPEAHAAEPARYVVTVRNVEGQTADVMGTIPTAGRSRVDLMMPVWSPGFYRVEDYAQKVQDLEARGEDGTPLTVLHPTANEWTVESGKRARIVIAYRLLCDRRSVTTNEIAPTYAVFNPAATFVVPRTVVQARQWPIRVSLELPPGWTAVTALPGPKASARPEFRADDYETLVDSPILAGVLSVYPFDVSGREHLLVGAGDMGAWDGARRARDLARIVAETRRFWGFLPYKRYVFLSVFREGGGGLEHKDSTLFTSSAARLATPKAYLGWLGFVGHEYFHAFNVKRLRPVELGPFDFDKAPTTGSLWIPEGLTTYFAKLMVHRSGLSTREDYLGQLSAQIKALQSQPGRLLQTVEESSREVWSNSNSGVGPSASTVSYYVKGDVLGFVLDARIRKATNGRRSIDDLLRLAYKRYSGARGFSAAQFEATAADVAGVDLSSWFARALRSTEELDYGEALDWFGLRFQEMSDAPSDWTLTEREDATPEQAGHRAAWLGGSPGH